MTQREIKKMFNQEYKHDLMTQYKGDKTLWKECYSNYIDSLCKDGLITQKQYDNIDYPKWMKQ